MGRAMGSQIQESFATGLVQGTGIGNNEATSGAGGFIGVLDQNGIIEDSYSTGAVVGASSVPVGGFAGRITTGTIRRSYSVGTVSNAAKFGGFLGLISEATLEQNIWDSEASSQSLAYHEAPSSVDGISLGTTGGMGQESTFVALGWDLSAVWILEGTSYPNLRWE